MKTRILRIFFKQYFCLLEYNRECSVGQNPPKKGHFMDAQSVRKTLKTFNLTTTTAILVKLTTILQRKVIRDICGGFQCSLKISRYYNKKLFHLQMSVNRKPLRARN